MAKGGEGASTESSHEVSGRKQWGSIPFKKDVLILFWFIL